MQVYHYKNSLAQGGWTPFSLSEKDGKRWNLFCQELALINPQDPNPYFADYLTFINKIDIERKANGA